ncbi:class I SAM-dependent methyltransferase [Sandaracinobacteroides sp. A072]|uniref:class I SAM-dependent methyltransferase n=1 Tax=Sandaracinobacteroides sp. A072 TaxID=3461146 RepID=UPI0040410221
MEPFDRDARRRARDRAARLLGDRDDILRHVAGELAERARLLGPVPDGPALRIGLMVPPPQGVICADPGFDLARRHGGVQCDEDRLPFADAAFAHIVGLMTLHGVNDLPGALILCRRALKPGGRFQAAFPAGLSLGGVRQAFLAADMQSGRGVPVRLGPAVDPAEAAGLLQRAGFVDPVAEVETLRLRFASLAALARDVRAHGDSGWLAARARGLTTPRRWMLAERAFAEGADPDGRIGVDLQILYLSARAP